MAHTIADNGLTPARLAAMRDARSGSESPQEPPGTQWRRPTPDSALMAVLRAAVAGLAGLACDTPPVGGQCGSRRRITPAWTGPTRATPAAWMLAARAAAHARA
jgi:hypothetical protein